MTRLFILALGVLFLGGCFGGPGEPVAVVPGAKEPKLDRPTFEAQVDTNTDAAFDAALEAVPVDQVPGFEEVIDTLDADSIVERTSEELLALETEADRAERAESQARQVARVRSQTEVDNRGLEFRRYSEALYNETIGVRAAIVYFTGADCAECEAWEEGLRAEADAFSDRNTLIMLANIDADAGLAAKLGVAEAGQGMILTGIGELMGPRPSRMLQKEDLLFIFK